MNEMVSMLLSKQYLLTFAVLLVFNLNIFAQKEEWGIPERWDYAITLDDRLQTMEGLPEGPFVRLGKKVILAASSASGKDVLITEDNGKSWKAYPVFENPEKYSIGAKAVQRTADGIVILAFSNPVERHWTWSDSLGDAPDARLPTYVVRSIDNGRTWETPKKLHDDWTGYITDMIITSRGNIVFTSMKMLHNPGRHAVLTYMSDDEGETWQSSNLIDFGGAGHHGGLTEPTLVELRDGKLMKLIRTNWMEFWRAESVDDGRTWHPIGPSRIPASPAHGQMERLESGRIVLVWNRPYPEGENTYPMVGGDNVWSAVPVSNFRGELSMAFSEDEGETWSEPVVIARTETGGFRETTAGGTGKPMPRREVSYPYVFEASPGEIWITTSRGPLRARLYEKDFVKDEMGGK